MSNAIIGVALPANMVEVVRLMLEELSRAPDKLSVAYKVGELYGSIQALERLQRLSRANAGRLCQHADGVARQREIALQEKPQ